jgi:hypothetical protein
MKLVITYVQRIVIEENMDVNIDDVIEQIQDVGEGGVQDMRVEQ